MKVSKDALLTEIAKDTGIKRETVRMVWDSLFSNVILSISRGDRVILNGFGTFVAQHRAPRTGRNPHTNEPVPIPARTIPKFIPGEWLKKAAYIQEGK